MSGFKDMVENDINGTFLNTNEFAEIHHIVYDGKEYDIPAVLDNTTQKDRNIVVLEDHAQGIFVVATTIYLSFADFQCLPKKGQRIWVNDEEFRIVTSAHEMGQIALGLQRYDE